MKSDDVLIEKYLMGACTKPEREKVERLAKEDTNFSQELRLSRLAFASITIGERERQKARLLALSRDLKKVVPLYIRYRRSLQVAATCLILTALGVAFHVWGLWTKTPSKSITQKLFAENFSPEKNKAVYSFIRAVPLAFETTDRMRIVQQLDHSHCEEAEKGIAKLMGPNDESYIALGKCYMKQRRPIEALKILNKVSPDAMQTDQASWYKILAHLQNNDREAAIEQLCMYKGAAYVYKKSRVLEILKELEYECE